MRASLLVMFIALAGSGCHGASSWSAPMPEVYATPQAVMYALHNGAVQSSYDTVVVARFITQWPAPPCKVQTMGDCTLTRCEFTDGGASLASTYVDAGTVTFTGAGGPIALDRAVDPDPNFANWYQADLGTATWNEGATFELQGTGGVAPAFMITVPAA